MMVQITAENRPVCVKCQERPALCRMSEMWICGQCLHEYKLKLMAQNKKAFLEG